MRVLPLEPLQGSPAAPSRHFMGGGRYTDRTGATWTRRTLRDAGIRAVLIQTPGRATLLADPEGTGRWPQRGTMIVSSPLPRVNYA